MTVTRPEIVGVPGVPETVLSEALVARLPENLTPAPWDARCQAVTWFGRGGDAALAALPAELRKGARAVAVVGGVVRYVDTPVGTYDEVFGIVVARSGGRPWGCVAFMAVDSEPSLVGGRANWAMPKTLASFEGSIRNGSTITARGADAVTWSISVTPRTVVPPIPYRSGGLARQQFPDGQVRGGVLKGTFRMRPALVRVSVESEVPAEDGGLPAWLRPGLHPGSLSPEMRFSLGRPT